jgi:hypothetical protein
LRERELWLRVSDLLATAGHTDVKVVHSSHSVDVLPLRIGKTAVVERLRTISDGACVQLGDRGRWPGNDAELLALPHSLSVDEVSPRLDTCWNVVAGGRVAADAAAWYLQCLRHGRFTHLAR